MCLRVLDPTEFRCLVSLIPPIAITFASKLTYHNHTTMVTEPTSGLDSFAALKVSGG